MIIAAQILNSSHGHRRTLVVLMIIRLMPHRNLLLMDSPHELALHMTARRIGRRKRLPKNIAHVVEEPCSTEKNRRVTLTMVQEELCEAVALIRRLRQPIFRRILILPHFFSLEVQFAEDILSVWIPLTGGVAQQLNRPFDIFRNTITQKAHLPQAVLSVLVSKLAGTLIPQGCFAHSSLSLEKPSQRILRLCVPYRGRASEPLLRLFLIRQHAKTIPVRLAQVIRRRNESLVPQ